MLIAFNVLLHYKMVSLINTHIELEPGVEVIVRHHVNLGHEGVHVALMCHQPDNGWLPTGLILGLGIVLKALADPVHHLQ